MPCQTRDEMPCITGRNHDDVMPWETRVVMSRIPEYFRDDVMPCESRDEMPCTPNPVHNATIPRNPVHIHPPHDGMERFVA